MNKQPILKDIFHSILGEDFEIPDDFDAPLVSPMIMDLWFTKSYDILACLPISENELHLLKYLDPDYDPESCGIFGMATTTETLKRDYDLWSKLFEKLREIDAEEKDGET